MAKVTLRLKNLEYTTDEEHKTKFVRGVDADENQWLDRMNMRARIGENDEVSPGRIEVRLPLDKFPTTIDTSGVYLVDCTVGFIRRNVQMTGRRVFNRETGRMEEIPGRVVPFNEVFLVGHEMKLEGEAEKIGKQPKQ